MVKYIKLKNFFPKDAIKEMKRQTMLWERIFGAHIFDQELISRVHKEVLKFNKEKNDNPTEIWISDLNKHLKKKRIPKWQIM